MIMKNEIKANKLQEEMTFYSMEDLKEFVNGLKDMEGVMLKITLEPSNDGEVNNGNNDGKR